MYQETQRRFIKKILGGLVGLFLLAQVFVFGVAPAYASVPVIDTAAQAERAAARAEVGFLDALKLAAFQGVMNAATFFVRKVAYDTAVYVASGGKGQSALIFQDGIDGYLGNVALDTAAEAIHQIGEPFGLNLCQLPDIRIQTFLQIGLREIYSESPTPNCTWTQFRSNIGFDEDGKWSPKVFEDKYGKNASKLIPQKFSDVVSVKQSDFGISLGAIGQIDRVTVGREQAAAIERIANQGIKDVTGLISGDIVTPAESIQKELGTLSAKEQADLSIEQLSGIYGTELLNLIPFAGQVFLNAFASTLLKNALSDGIVPERAQYSQNAFGIFRDNRAAAEAAFTDFKGVDVGAIAEYDVISHFSACPKNPRLNNCVMDADLARAVARGGIEGEAMTIQEAMDEGLLHPEWPLISPRREVDNTDVDCYKQAYCYSNIQKMRKARILPIGFEIAAFKADPDQTNLWTLKKVVENFDNCAPNGQPSNQYPYCHLINPNWVIKAPAASCPTEGFGPNLLTGRSPNRAPECIDLSTCVAKDADGKCISQGYCTKEKNTWNFVADSCRAEYATCRTYTRRTGSASSYLSRTLDYSQCTKDSVGCRAYSLEQNAQGQWLQRTQVDLALKQNLPGRNQVVYFNEKIRNYSCSKSDNGCHAFFTGLRDANEQLVTTGTGQFVQDPAKRVAYLKKAPDYLGCYDANLTTKRIDPPLTLTQIRSDVSQDARCNDFARVCLASEVGCESYTQPADPTAPAIPGKVGANSCSSSCVGYDTYKQLDTKFERGQFPLYFVPTEAQLCSRENRGCDEFTNLDESSAGGEKLEYYTDIKYCEKPNANNQKAFYSWEGSDVEGFVLRVHNLRPMAQADTTYIVGTNPNLGTANAATVFRPGSPAYADDMQQSIENNYRDCNEAAYLLRIQDRLDPAAAEPDCRQLYDDNGEVYYRMLGKTISVSDQCRRLRKTNAEFYVDTALTSQTECTAKFGNWDATQNQCQRCFSGGQYVAGTCVYNAIPGATESQACPASENLCRHYVGNTGRDVNETVVVDDFEGQNAATGWGIGRDAATQNPAGLRTAAESIEVGGNSLRIDAPAVARQISTNTLSFGASYELSFWARGASQNVTIGFAQNGIVVRRVTADPNTGAARSITIGDAWREYRVGPVALDIDFSQSNTIDLVFERTPGTAGPYFIDYVRLTQLQDQIFLIKDSWKKDYNNDGQVTDAPNVCDANPGDGFPGAALGCREYRDTRNNPVFATGFDTLCREEAVGCEPLWDTYNTLSDTNDSDAERMHVYNLGCVAASGQTCTLRVTFDATRTDEYSCAIGGNTNTCTIPQKVVVPSTPGFQFPQQISGPNSTARVVTSTIIIPADVSSSSLPLFLAAGKNGKHRCTEGALGCIETGREQQVLPDPSDPNAFRYTPAMVKNDPALYSVETGQGSSPGTLCQDELIGCEEFKSNNDTVYFKDPKVAGQSLCKYREGVPRTGGARVSGWFYDGLGQCQNGNLCRQDSDCGPRNTCQNINAVSCYPSFIRRTAGQGIVFDIRSNDSVQYRGLVGVCQDDQHMCTEYVDPTDKSALHPAGKPYYVLKNEKLKDKERSCEAGASRVKGCILFNETSNPARPYSTTSTYVASANASPAFRQVPPQSGPNAANNDSNVVLKVDRDRECSEWLSCKSAIVHTESDGRQKELCYDYRACNAINPDGSCANWVGQNELSLLPLSEGRYTTRKVGWNDPEYSGYTLHNTHQINDFQYISFDLSAQRDRATSQSDREQIKRLEETQYLVYPFTNADRDCRLADGTPKEDLDVCGPNERGRCIGQRCYTSIDGNLPPSTDVPTSSLTVSQLRKLFAEFDGSSCKAYPEEDSPFPKRIVNFDDSQNQFGLLTVSSSPGTTRPYRDEIISTKEGFERANICQDGECSCAYKKIEYNGGPTDYWQFRDREVGDEIAEGVCVGGANDGRPCTRTSPNCGANSECKFIKKKETHVGLQGFCLERDLSRPINGGPISGQTTQDFACMTWLPIQVSASTVDIFNTHLSAGYFPDVDAKVREGQPTYGKVYCAAATQTGQGVYQSNMFGGAVDRTRYNSLVSQYFTNNQNNSGGYFLDGSGNGERLGQARLGRNDRECGPDVGWPYTSFICRTTFTKQSAYQLMQTWAWRAIGSNAAVMRIERKPTHIPLDATEWQPTDIRLSANTDGSTNLPVHHMVGVPPQMNCPLIGSCGPDAGAGVGGYGVVMHPPRLWGQSTSVLNPAVGILRNEFFYPQTGARPLVAASIAGPALSPEQNYGGDTGISSYVHQYDIESVIREQDIDRIYVVPLAYPDGIEGAMPQLMTDDLYIDFTAIQKSPTQGEVHNVRSVYFSTSVSSPDGDTMADPLTFTGTRYGGGSFSFDDGTAWTYAVSRNVTPGNETSFLPSESSYAFDTYPISNSIVDPLKNQQRNKIAKRYVLTYITRVGQTSDGRGREAQFYQFGPQTNDPKKKLRPEPPQALADDPFGKELDCGKNNTGWENWFAIGLDFNEDGEFLGYISRFCNQSPEQELSGVHDDDPWADNGMMLAVVASLKDQCTEFATVYKEDNLGSSQGTNKAWTNRVWQFASNRNAGSVTPQMVHPLNSPRPYEVLRTKFNPPFGSLHLQDTSFRTGNIDVDELRNYTIRHSQRRAGDWASLQPDGLPYSCPELSWNNRDTGAATFALAGIGPSNSTCVAASRGSNVYRTNLTGGGGTQGAVSNRSRADSYRAIKQLFSKVFTVARYSGRNANGLPQFAIGSTSIPAGTPALNATQRRMDDSIEPNLGNVTRTGLLPPQIYSLNPDRCKNRAQTGSQQVVDPCVAGEANNITVNNRNSTLRNYNRDPQNRVDEDSNGNGFVDPIIGNAVYTARVEFFAFADDNRMPIRRVMVDWGDNNDGSQIVNRTRFGLYKNRKPFCSAVDSSQIDVGLCGTSPTALTSLTCNTHNDCPLPAIAGGSGGQRCYSDTATADTDLSNAYQFSKFGNAKRACTARPFTFTHDYTCTLQDVDIANPSPWTVTVGSITNPDVVNQLRQYGLTNNQRVCRFVPRVQALDNWGWCNGVNADGSPRPQGYYNDALTGGGRATRCEPMSNPASTPSIRANNDAWTPYQGEIFVVPPTAT